MQNLFFVNLRYRDFREPPDSPNANEVTIDFYHVLAARLIFFVIFEHFIFFTVTLLHWIVRDVPRVIEDQIEQENTMIQQTIWSTHIDISRTISQQETRVEGGNIKRNVTVSPQNRRVPSSSYSLQEN